MSSPSSEDHHPSNLSSPPSSSSTSASPPPSSITAAPPPWSTKNTTFCLPFYSSAPLPPQAYTPLTASHPPFSSESQCGIYKGGLGMIYMIRYSETPLGAYDELAIMPGYFENDVECEEKGSGIKQTKKAVHTRVTAIWVSQKSSCWNGRKNWNIPKHLARFKFTPPFDSPSSPPSFPLRIEVFPEDPSATTPFFSANILPVRWLPPFRCSSEWSKYIGMDTHIVQPPLPKGNSPELCGTDDWKKSHPVASSRKARWVWIDMQQPSSSSSAPVNDQADRLSVPERRLTDENWWPGFKRWHIGLWLDDATLNLGEVEILSIPKT